MMKPSEFQTTIENQFDYICKVAMEDERKDYLKALSRQCKRETLFCDMDDYTVNLFSSEDTYPSHFHTFEMDGFTVRIENSLLAEALENLDGKKRDVILRYYFLGFDDTEISKILEVNRSTIQRRRHAVRSPYNHRKRNHRVLCCHASSSINFLINSNPACLLLWIVERLTSRIFEISVSSNPRK